MKDAELPPATRTPPGAELAAYPLEGPWRALATSTLDNGWGDVGPVEREGVLPVQVWLLEHAPDGREWR